MNRIITAQIVRAQRVNGYTFDTRNYTSARWRKRYAEGKLPTTFERKFRQEVTAL